MSKRKFFLAGCAILAAGTSARAADAIVMAPQPEPVEYVRVCDVYGAGFFYIPGTETCLQISGFVFYQVGAASDVDANDTPNYDGFSAGQFNSYLRTRVAFDARSETEWGTLRSYISVQTDYYNGSPDEFGSTGNDPNLGLDEAWLSIGGLRVGYAPSAFTYTVNGGASGYGSHTWNGLIYGDNNRNFVQYNFTGANGLFATVSLEQDFDTGVTYIDKSGNAVVNTSDYAPDVVGKIGVTQGWGTAWLDVAVDTEAEATGVSSQGAPDFDATIGRPGPSGDTEFVVEGGIHYTIPGLTGDSLRVLGFYASDPNSYFSAGEWAVIGSYYHTFSSTFGASVGGEYIADINFDGPGSPDQYLAEIGLVWTPVTNFEVRSEITYNKITNLPAGVDLGGTVSGYLRLQRSF